VTSSRCNVRQAVGLILCIGLKERTAPFVRRLHWISAVTQGHGELYYEATTIYNHWPNDPLFDLLSLAISLAAFAAAVFAAVMSSAAAPPAGGRRSRNVFGRPHPARAVIDAIHRQFHNPPREVSSNTPIDRRRNSKGRSVVLGEYTREGLLQL